MSRWPEASFDLEIPWTFRDPYTDWECPGDLIICVSGDGDVTTGEVDGWEITAVCEVFPGKLGFANRRVYLDMTRPMLKAMLEILHDDKRDPQNVEGQRFNIAVRDAASDLWRAAA
jgi:hypothetical protein